MKHASDFPTLFSIINQVMGKEKKRVHNFFFNLFENSIQQGKQFVVKQCYWLCFNMGHYSRPSYKASQVHRTFRISHPGISVITSYLGY